MISRTGGRGMLATRVLAILLAASSVSACRTVQGSPTTDSAKAVAVPSQRWVIAGCDISGSYHNATPCLDMVLSLIQNELRGGDRIFVRLIGQDSYLDPYAVVTLVMPDGPPPVKNPWDPKERARLGEYERKFAALKNKAIARLRDAKAYGFQGLTDAATQQTDVLGFLAKAGELLGKAPSAARRIVFIGSDLIDTRNLTGLSINLSGASVLVGQFENSNAAASDIQKRKIFWTSLFKKFGAREVAILDPAEGTGGNGGLLAALSSR